MKTSEELKLRLEGCSFTCEGDDGTLIKDVALLEDVVEAAKAIVKTSGGGEFDKYSGFDNFTVDYREMDYLMDALAKLENTNEQ